MSHSSPHSFVEAHFNAVKNDRRRSEYLEMNLFSVANFPVSLYMLLGDKGLHLLNGFGLSRGHLDPPLAYQEPK